MMAMIWIRYRKLKWACAAAAMAWAVMAGAGGATQTLETIGCDGGRVECQANELAECVCEEAWVETLDGEKYLRVCHWQATGEGCGGTVDVSLCAKAYEGVERMFAGVRKECVWIDEDCYWR